MTNEEIIRMARYAFACTYCPLPVPEDRIAAFAKLVADKAVAKDRQDYFVSLDSNEMLLRLVREYNGEFCHYVYKFSANQLMNSLDSMPAMVAEKARIMACKVEAAIKAKEQA